MVDMYSTIFDNSFASKIDLCIQDNIDNVKTEDYRYPYWDEIKFLKEKGEKDMWNLFSKEIFFIFWQLDLQDITKPDDIYNDYIKGQQHTPAEIKQINILKEKIKEINEQFKKKGKTEEDLEKRQQLEDKIKFIQNAKFMELLKHEQTGPYKENNAEVMKYLKEKLKEYFGKIRPREREMSATEIYGSSIFLIQNCLYPRLMMSPADALYSINFLKLMVELQVPNINMRNIFTQIFFGMFSNTHCCTNNESE